MEIGKTLYVHKRQQWLAWLEKHFQTEPEIWLILPKKDTGKPKLLYNSAVEEALCFGWIDSIMKTLDESNSAQRYSPRKPKSNWSQPNRERIRWLLARNMVHPLFVEEYQQIANEPFIFPEDIIEAIKQNQKAWQKYQHFSESYKRIRIASIDAARNRPEEFAKRLEYFIKKSAENKLIAYGGIEKYY